MSKHTLGPWIGREDQGVYLGDGSERPIFETGCGCCTKKTLTEADARLIAAAPCLLEALKNLLESHYNGNVINADCLEAETAIAKATEEA